MLTSLAYARGVLALSAMLLSVGAASVRLRGVLVPDWRGAPARLVEAILGLSLVTVLLEVFGAVGLFRPGAVLIGVPLIAGLLAWRLPRAPRPAASAWSRPDPWTIVALSLAVVVALQWLAHATPVLGRGFDDMDSLRYHGPFVARWLQDHTLLRLQHTSGELQETFFPATSELLGAYGVLAFGRDLLAPLLNFGWFALGALAAWCAGSGRVGRAAALAGYAAVWSLPLLTTIEPGSAKNDVAVSAFVVAAAALLTRALTGDVDRRQGVLVVAGLAAGLAVGTKLSALAAVAVLLGGVVAIASPRRRTATTLAAATATTGAFWYLRDLLDTGNPLPWIHRIGPVVLGGPAMTAAATGGWSVLRYAGDGWFWLQTVPAGLRDSFGPAWPIVVGGAVVLVVGVATGRAVHPARRVVALAALVAALAYTATPYSAGGSPGHPDMFGLDLRFLAPALSLAVTLASTRRRALGLVVGAATVVVVDQVSGVGRWPTPVLAVVAAGAIAAGVVAAAIVLAHRARARRPWAALAAAFALVAGAGWAPAHAAMRDRYARAHSGLTAAFAMFRSTDHLRIAVGGFADDYPLYGAALTNRVDVIGVPLPHGGFRMARTCDEWQDALAAGHDDYVVVSRSPVARQRLPIEARWTARDTAYALVLDRGVTRVFRRVDASDGETCEEPRSAVASSHVAGVTE